MQRAITLNFPVEDRGQEYAIKYKDLDDDLVTIRREADFRFACTNLGLLGQSEGQVGRRMLKVYLFPKERSEGATSPAGAVNPAGVVSLAAPLSIVKPVGGGLLIFCVCLRWTALGKKCD